MDHGAQHTVERATAFLAGAVEEKEPLFLFINLLEPHWRYLPPLLDRLALLPEGIDVLAATWTATQMYGPLLMAGKPSRGPTLAVVRAFYAAAVRYQDRHVGELLKRIDATLGAENTLVIITADHGENLGEAGRWDHVFAINDHLLRVPLTIRLPAHFPAGLRVAEACGLIDIPATVADLVPELDFPTGAGRTLVPQHLRPREFVFAEGDPFRLHRERMSAYASPEQLDTLFASLVTAQSSRFKYQRSTAAEPMLFDLDSDPDESNNVLENWPEEAATLGAELDRWLADTGPAPEDTEDPTTLRDEDLEALRELGYIGNP